MKITILFFSIAIFLFPMILYAQLGKTYTSVNEISKNPLEVYAIDLKNQKLDSIPDAIFLCENTKILIISKNFIKKIPKNIEKLIHLEELYISDNQLYSLPNELLSLKKLKKINLSYNIISKIPQDIYKLGTLKSLDLSNNKLTELPQNINKLKYLEELIIDENELTTLPSFENLISLKILSIAKNKLTNIPSTIIKIATLTTLNMKDNPILCQQDQNLISFLQKLPNISDNIQNCLSNYNFNILSNIGVSPELYNTVILLVVMIFLLIYILILYIRYSKLFKKYSKLKKHQEIDPEQAKYRHELEQKIEDLSTNCSILQIERDNLSEANKLISQNYRDSEILNKFLTAENEKLRNELAEAKQHINILFQNIKK